MLAGQSLFDLSGRVAIVTGAGQGLGRAFAIGLAEHGARTVVVDVDAENGSDTARTISDSGGESMFVRADVSDKGQVDSAFEQIVGAFGQIDILVNNAGVWSFVPTLDLTLDAWSRVVAINLTGTLLCCQAAARHMIPRGRGNIVNISSISGVLGNKERAAYAATKHGVIGLTKALANEWAMTGVRVNAIGPGAHETEMTRVWRDNPSEQHERQIRKIPMGRLGRPEELVGTLVFLAGDASSYMTGQTLFSDGGWLLE
jgi:2-deoxy-D-gluconate 3-dehydrogenase